MNKKIIFILFVYFILINKLFSAIGGYQKLPWQDYEWIEAKEGCSDLGMTLPTRAELTEVANLSRDNGEYWSNDEINSNDAYVFRMSDKWSQSMQKYNKKTVYCIYYGSTKPTAVFVPVAPEKMLRLTNQYRWPDAVAECAKSNMQLPSRDEMKAISKSGGNNGEYWTRDIIDSSWSYQYRITGSSHWTEDFIQNMQNVNYKNVYCISATSSAPAKPEDINITVSAGIPTIIDNNFSLNCSTSLNDIAIVEVINSDSSPGEISFIEYDQAIISSLSLTVDKSLSSNGQLIFKSNSGLSSANWEKVFKSLKFKANSSDVNKTFKILITVKKSPTTSTIKNIELGAVSLNPETTESLTTTLAKWQKYSDINITGYDGANSTLASIHFVTTTTKTKLADHVSTGLGVNGKSGDDGQIDWISDSKLPAKGYAEKIVINFAKPITDIKVGFSGLGDRFTASGGAKAVYEFYYKDVLVRSRGKLDREADFDSDGYVATNMTTTNLIVDKMIFTILIDGTNFNSANFSVRYITANYYKAPSSTNCDLFTKSYVISVKEEKINIPDTGSCIGVELNGTGYLEFNQSKVNIPNYIHGFNLIWSEGNSICSSKSMRYPKRNELEILKNIFITNNFSNDWWWSYDTSGSENGWHFKLDNNHIIIEESVSQKDQTRYKSKVYCTKDPTDYQLFNNGDFNFSIGFSGSEGSLVEIGTGFKFYKNNDEVILSIGGFSSVLSNIRASDIFDGVVNYLNLRFISNTGEVIIFLNGQFIEYISNSNWIGKGIESGTNGYFGKNFKGEIRYLSFESGGKKAIWDMNSMTSETLSDSNNIFNLSLVGDAKPIDQSCQTTGVIINNPTAAKAKFIFKVREKNRTDYKITTQTAGKYFELEFLAFDENGTLQNYDGNISAKLIDNSNLATIYDIGNIIFTNNNTIVKGITPSSISKSCFVKIESTDYNGISDDNFSIRPDKFVFSTMPTSIISGNSFNVSINAVNLNGSTVSNYNESNSSTSSLDFNYSEIKSNCSSKPLSNISSPISFSNGTVSISPKYPEIGRIKFSISERNGYEFAKTDKLDTSDSQRLIKSAEAYLDLNLSQIAISAELLPYENNYTYYSNDLSKMAGKISIRYEAKNSENTKTANFKNGCYSEKIDTNISLNGTSGFKLLADKGYVRNNTIEYNLSSTDFTDGELNISYRFNFERNASQPQNMIVVSLSEVNISKFMPSKTAQAQTTSGSSGGYKHTSSLPWDQAKALCESKGLKLPTRAEANSSKSVFQSNNWNNNFWSADESGSNAYIYRFQNNFTVFWAYEESPHPKVNYNDFYCLASSSNPKTSNYSLVGSVPFYYARMISPDLSIDEDETNVSLRLEIYSSVEINNKNVFGDKLLSNNWYRHLEANQSLINEVNLSTPYSSRLLVREKNIKLLDKENGTNIDYPILIELANHLYFVYNLLDDSSKTNSFDVKFNKQDNPSDINSDPTSTQNERIPLIRGKRVEW